LAKTKQPKGLLIASAAALLIALALLCFLPPSNPKSHYGNTFPSEDSVAPGIESARPAQERATGELTARSQAEGRSFRGRVLDKHGEGIPNATITATSIPGSFLEAVCLVESVLPWAFPAPFLSTKTTEDGAYELPPVLAEGVLLYAEEPKHSPAGVFFEGALAGPFDLLLEEGYSLAGSVEDERGSPVTDATVRVRRNPTYPPQPHRTPPEQAIILFRFCKQAKPDAKGEWSIQGIQEGHYILEAHGPGWSVEGDSDLEVPHPGPIRVVLRSGATLTGQVTEAGSGAPLRHAFVGVQYPPPGEDGAPFERGPDTRTDEEGHYRLEGVRTEKTASLDITRQGFSTYRSHLREFAPGEVRLLDIALIKGCRLIGHVRSEEGKPIAAADLTYEALEGITLNPGSLTDDNGLFIIPRLTPGIPIMVVAEAEGYAPREMRNVVPPLDDLVVTLPRLASIAGTVETTGGPVPSFIAVLSKEGRLVHTPIQRREISDPSGAFLFDGIAPAQYRLRIEADSFAPFVSEPLDVASGQSILFHAHLAAGARVRGRVVTHRDGQPLSHVRVVAGEIRPRGEILGPHGETATTDDAGEYVLEHCPAGSGTLLFYRGDSLRALVHYEAGEAETTRLPDVAIGNGAVIEGRVLGPEGKPIRGATVVSRPAWTHANVETRTDGQGRYHLVTAALTTRINVGPVDELSGEWQRMRPEVVVELAEGETRQVDFHLEPRGKVFGQVRLRGRPVEVQSVVDLRDTGTGTRIVGGCFLAPGAGYALLGVGPGSYHVLCRSLDVSFAFDSMREVTVGEGEAVRCDFDLQGSGIEGVLRTPAGTLLQVPSVLLYPLGRGVPGSIRLPILVERDGSFASLGLSGGRYRLEARAAGCAPAIVPSIEVPDARTVRVDIDLEPEASIALACRRPDGSPTSGVQLALHRSGDPSWPVPAAVVTGLDGAASFRGLASGTYEVEMWGEGIFPLRTPLVLKLGDNLRVDLPVRRRGDLEILARGEDGSPRAAESISVVDFSTGVEARAWVAAGLVAASDAALRTDATGRLTLTGLPEGTFRVGAGLAQVSAAVPPQGAGTATITIP
jgi:protocatechuate 3,4-dioxygenase beta subunit